MPKANYQIARKCKICGSSFLAKNVDSMYCSKRCSNAAYRKKKKAEKEAEAATAMAAAIPDERGFLTISEAVAIFAVSRNTIYRLLRNNQIPYFNLGTRLTRIDRSALSAKFEKRKSGSSSEHIKIVKSYIMEPDTCYTVGAISEKFKMAPSSVYSLIRKYAIPTRQIGKFVYVPKDEIDRLLS